MHFGRILGIGALLATALTGPAPGQTAPAVILSVDIQNVVIYQQDFGDATRFATDPNKVAPPPIRNFAPVVWVADIVAVNGKPAKGTWTVRGTLVARSTTLSPGNALADSAAAFVFDWAFDIRHVDGTQIGTIMASGWGGADKPPGAPSSFVQANMTVTGGTGAFLGVRGQGGQGGATDAGRIASMAEDPAYRRLNGGGARRYVFHLLPMEQPEIVNVWHSDFSPVSAARPARADEILILSARGLGPTRPGVDPGVAFPASPLQVVNSPVEMTVGGQPAEVIAQIGWPGEQNLYRLDFRMPKTSGPTAALQVSAAWIGGPAFNIPVQ
jgi:uncharacterized protein (TIGR03437 family)